MSRDGFWGAHGNGRPDDIQLLREWLKAGRTLTSRDTILLKDDLDSALDLKSGENYITKGAKCPTIG